MTTIQNNIFSPMLEDMGAVCSSTSPRRIQENNSSNARNEMSVNSIRSRHRTKLSVANSSSDSSSNKSSANFSESPFHQSSHGPPSPSLPIPEDPKVAAISKFSNERYRKLLTGRLDLETKHNDKIIQLHIIANSSDWDFERDIIFNEILPKLRDELRKTGYELETTDFRYGLVNEYVHNYQVHSLIKQIKNTSKNHIILICLGCKYGPLSLPIQLEYDEFTKIIKAIGNDTNSVSLLNSVYEFRDSFLPVKMHLVESPQCGETNNLIEWEKTMETVYQIFQQYASKDFKDLYLRSSLDNEIRVILESKLNDGIVLIQRLFSGNQATNNNYFETDENKIDALKQLNDRVTEKIDASKRICFTVPWLPNGIDCQQIAHKIYLDSVREEVNRLLREVIDRKIEDITEIEKRSFCANISQFLKDELDAQTKFSQASITKFVGRDELLAKMKNYLLKCHPTSDTANRHRPLLLHGLAGCGKTSIAAWLAHHYCYQDGWTGGMCILRHIGVTVNSQTMQQLLRSLAEQLCMLSDTCLSFAYKTTSQYVAIIGELIKKSPKSVPLLVIIDGMDNLAEGGKGGWGWIPRDFPNNVRFVLTTNTNSSSHKTLRTFLETTDYELEIGPLTSSEAIGQLQLNLTQYGSSMSSRKQSLVQSNIGQQTHPIYTRLIAAHSVIWGETPQFNNDLELQTINFLNRLQEYFYGYELLTRLLLYLSCSRFGLSGNELLDLLSLYNNNNKNKIFDNINWLKNNLKTTPIYILLLFQMHMDQFLMTNRIGGKMLFRFRHEWFERLVLKTYSSFVAEIRQEIYEYFKGGRKPSIVYDHREMETTNAYNRRKFDEITWQTYKLDGEKFIKDCLLNVNLLRKRICACTIYSVIQDFTLASLLKSASISDNHTNNSGSVSNSNNNMVGEAFTFFIDFLQNSTRVLSHDGLQLNSQILFRIDSDTIRKYPEIKKLYHDSLTFKKSMLIAKPSCFNNNSNIVKDDETASVCGIFRMDAFKRHIIVLKTSQLLVINTDRNEIVRTLNGLNKPRNVKMLSETLAVVLCERQLFVYDLDECKLMTKLKGVLNLNMPFYGVIDNRHVIALSRNRMYVNIINAVSGDMVSTFKVGEDRFLNSLLISKNGQKCVCGDEVQKPFPLLVWDLSNRKLIHDLRIPSNEFVTAISAIDDEGKFVVCACKDLQDPQPTFLITYELQSGVLFKKWKPDYGLTCVAITKRFVIAGIENGQLLIWDLISGSLKHTLNGHCHGGPTNIAIDKQSKRFVTFNTTGRDNSIRLWDIENGTAFGSICTDRPVDCCEISADGKQIFIGLPIYDDIITLSLNEPVEKEKEIFGNGINSGKVSDIERE